MRIMILPLIDRSELVDRAVAIKADLESKGYIVEMDSLQTFGKRAHRYCNTYRIAVDWETIEKDTVYLLCDDGSKGARVALEDLPCFLQAK